MTQTSGNNLHIATALTVSLILHLVAFGMASSVKDRTHTATLQEYIPVDLVQLPVVTRTAERAPVTAAPQPAKTPAPAVPQEHSAAAPAPMTQPVVPLPQAHPGTPAVGSLVLPRSPAVSGSGTAGHAAVSTAPPVVSGTGTPQPHTRDKGSYQAFHRLTRLPAFKAKTEPVYPNAERMSGSEARVLAEIYLDEQGAVDDVVIKKSGGRLFDRAVIDAARQSSFHPGYMGEKAVPCVIQIPYTFKLK